MASLQEPSTVIFYVKRPNNSLAHVYRQRVELLGPGGSHDGSIATTATPDVLLTLPPRTDLVFNRGDKLILSMISDASDGIDVSDCRILIPFLDASGGSFIVSDGMLTNWADVTVPAGKEVHIGEYEFEQGPFVFGGGKIFLSLEDDTA